MFEFGVMEFLLAGAELAPIVIFLVLSLTYLAGMFGLEGKAQLAFALIAGLIFGGGLQMAETGMPTNFAGWFWLVVYAGVLATIPSLLYEQTKEIVMKSLEQFAARLPDEVE